MKSGVTCFIDPAQFDALAAALAEHLSAVFMRGLKATVPRGSYTVAEVARRHCFSRDYVYKAIREGKLAAVRPGAGSEMRITPEAENLWLWGQRDYGDEPCMGVDPKVAVRASLKRLGAKP